MPPFRKPFYGDPLFPFDIVHRDRKHPQHELPDHLHDRYELVYVHAGRGTFFIDKTLYAKGPGDLFVIPGNTIHQAFTEAEDPIVSTAVFFAPAFVQADSLGDTYSELRCFDRARRAKHYKLVLSDDLRHEAVAAFDEMDRELRAARAGYRQAIRARLQLLLVQLGRQAEPEAAGEDIGSRVGPSWIRDALRAIDESPDRDAGLAELAARSSVSAAHFSRVFKQLTGMTVTDYVNAKRIVRAKELLRETEEGVGRVAESCGFESLPHFHRTFKRVTGQTPGAYRQDGRNGKA